jgi:hypothetical protein
MVASKWLKPLINLSFNGKLSSFSKIGRISMEIVLEIKREPTPNPNAMKFTLNRKVIEHGSCTFHADSEITNELAKRLFAIQGVKSLFFLNNFISVSRDHYVSWEEIYPKVEEVLKGYFNGKKGR